MLMHESTIHNVSRHKTKRRCPEDAGIQVNGRNSNGEAPIPNE